MFQQLRLKLSFINAFIILFLFLFLITGLYSFSQIGAARGTDELMKKIAIGIQAGQIRDLPLREENPGEPQFPPPPAIAPGSPSETTNVPPTGPDIFFVKSSPSGAILFQSSGQPLSQDRLTALTERALQSASDQGTITLGQFNYSYLKCPLTDTPGTLVVFHGLSQENNLRNVMLASIAAVGLFCLFVSIGASYFMANRAMMPIQKAWQQQKDFLSDASHEFRTPLAVIQSNLDAIKENSAETVSSQIIWLDNIQDVTVSMAKLVDSLLFLARTGSQQQTLEWQHFSMQAVIAQTVSYFEPAAAAKGISLETLFTPMVVEGFGDEARIKQVIDILLDNAIRHTPSGGNITVCLSQSDVSTFLTVADTGEGIERQYLDKIFDRFFQVDESRHTGSSGLGLAIAKSIVEGHNGTINVDSTPGLGATFTITFPWGKTEH